AVVVVVSAMAGETDRLIGLCKSIAPMPDPAEYDVVISSGEQVTSALTALALQAEGAPAVSLQGHQVRILTDDEHAKAKIEDVETSALFEALQAGKVVVVPGFQGITANGRVSTLGRGGSDLTAVALAAALKASVCEIYTDVDGVYTTDPGIVDRARKIPRIAYEEMLEMASLGAKVLQTRSVLFAMRYNVPVHVRSSFSDVEGTWVVGEEPDMEKNPVLGIAYNKNEGKIGLRHVPDRPGVAAKIFLALAKDGINVDMIIQNVGHDGMTDMTFTAPKDEIAKAEAVMDRICEEIGAERVETDLGIVKISIIGAGMRTHSGIAAMMFEALARVGINVQMISTSEIKISCIVDAKFTELAVRELHDTFGLAQGQVRAESL
ncbi:MAG: aspartate kinase, partial [Myxococcales bacterium]|nr:aspartate kinase [Myxococcales bacterium]